MHLDRLGKAYRLACQTFDLGVQCQVLPLDFLRVALARLVLIGIEMARVCAPIVRIILRNAKRFQQGFELQQHRIFAAPKDLRQDVTTAVINRGLEPLRPVFLARKRLYSIFSSNEPSG